MKVLELWIMDYLLNSIWQIPLVYATAWIAARLARPIGPRMEHRVWIGALIVQTILPACQFSLISLWQQVLALIPWSWGKPAGPGTVRVLVGPGIASGSGLLRLPAPLLTAIIAAYVCLLAYFAARLAWGIWRTDRMQRSAQLVPENGYVAQKLKSHSILFGPDPVHAAISSAISGPVTIGIRRHMLLLPPDFLEHVSDADLDAVLAHEFAHMRRRDFAKNLFYGILSLPATYHPALWLTSARLAKTREMVCDETAAEAVTGRESYSHALLRLASMLSNQTPARTLHAIGIFDANIFERRVMNLTQRRMEIPRARRMMIAAACAVIALVTCASAVALRMEVAAQAAQTGHPTKIHVKANDMKIVTQVPPVYPPKAKSAGIQGVVILAAVINKEGEPEQLRVEKGPSELQQSALDSVRQWRWQPYLLNGEPVEVETSVTITFHLEG